MSLFVVHMQAFDESKGLNDNLKIASVNICV